MHIWRWVLIAASCISAHAFAQALPGPSLLDPLAPAPVPNYGKFEGTLQVEWLPDERHLLVLAPFDFVDPNGVSWGVARGKIVDGSSIPSLARSLIGDPFGEKYLEATVIHDVACDDRDGDWEAAHAAFYHALMASGADKAKARLLYAAVYHFGPRWDTRLELKNVPAARAQAEAGKLTRQFSPGRDVKLVLTPRKPSAAELTSHAPRAVDILVTAPETRRTVNEVDFVMLRLAMEKRETSSAGPMSLEEIRNFQVGK